MIYCGLGDERGPMYYRFNHQAGWLLFNRDLIMCCITLPSNLTLTDWLTIITSAYMPYGRHSSSLCFSNVDIRFYYLDSRRTIFALFSFVTIKSWRATLTLERNVCSVLHRSFFISLLCLLNFIIYSFYLSIPSFWHNIDWLSFIELYWIEARWQRLTWMWIFCTLGYMTMTSGGSHRLSFGALESTGSLDLEHTALQEGI